jgi:hypothetical protein
LPSSALFIERDTLNMWVALFGTGRRIRESSVWFGREPSVGDLLAEPIVQALMQADGVDPEALAEILRRARLAVVRRKIASG